MLVINKIFPFHEVRHVHLLSVKMVKDDECVDVEPLVGDILSVWGLEPTKLNLAKVVFPTRYLGGKGRDSMLKWQLDGSLGSLASSKNSTSN